MAHAMSRFHEAIRRPRAGTLALVALLFLGSVLSSSAHWLATPHRLCSLHGAVEHGLVHGTPTDAESTTARTRTGPAYRSGGHAHEDCPFAPWARSEVLPLPALPVEAGRLLGAPRLADRVRGEPLPEQALYLLAPSRSPPHARA